LLSERAAGGKVVSEALHDAVDAAREEEEITGERGGVGGLLRPVGSNSPQQVFVKAEDCLRGKVLVPP
jgi:hypothetical protein